MADKYEFIVIGAGPAGCSAALTLAEMKKNVLLVDRNPGSLGGTCLNRGCIPMKTYLEEANKGAGETQAVFEKALSNITHIKKGLNYMLERGEVEFAWGEAFFISENRIRISSESGEQELQARKYIIAAGSEAASIAGIQALSSDYFFSAQNMKRIPDKIAIAGAGYVGCEFASFFNSLGKKVTLIEIKDNVLPGEDRDISDFLRKELIKSGIKLMTSTKITGTSENPDGIEITTESAGSFYAGLLLAAAGRKPLTKTLKLEKAGVKTTNGFIELAEKFKTSNPDIFAAGDVIDTPMLAHTATAEGKKAALQAAGEDIKGINYAIVPRVVFSNPQVGAIGMTERQAKEAGIKIAVKKNYFKANSKALIKGDTRGFVKVIYDISSGAILGAAAAGPESTELIHIMSAPVYNKMTISEFNELIFAHPTLSELFS